jgi:plastocyanin
MKTSRWVALLTLAALCVVPSARAGAQGNAQTNPQTNAQGNAGDEVVATVGADGVQRADIFAGSYFFRPRLVILKVGVPVELKVRKESGIAPHRIVVRAPEAGIDFAVGLTTEPKSIRFTPTKTGSYPMYCDQQFLLFATHRERGMEGSVEVRE